MNAEEAIRIVARHALVRSIEQHLDDDWDMYPDIGESDWDRVCSAARAMVVEPTDTTYGKAYKFLADRADHSEVGS